MDVKPIASPPRKEKDLTQRAQREEGTEITEKRQAHKAHSFTGLPLRVFPVRGAEELGKNPQP